VASAEKGRRHKGPSPGSTPRVAGGRLHRNSVDGRGAQVPKIASKAYILDALNANDAEMR
jgi:hypothetical protein